MAFSEFASIEFAAGEFAADGTDYADISCAASVSFTTLASVGLIIDIAGSAQLGATAVPDYTALASGWGSTTLTFTSAGGAGLVADVSPASAWSHTGAAYGGLTVTSSATAAFTFMSFSEPENLETAYASWRWNSAGSLGTFSGSSGIGSMGFMHYGDGSSLQGVLGLADLAWQPAARMTAVADVRGGDVWRFAAQGRVSAWSDSIATASVVWVAAPKVSATASSSGSSAASFTSIGAASTGIFVGGAGASSFTFASAGVMATWSGVRGIGSMGFSGAGSAGTAVASSAAGDWSFTSRADPGATIHKSLPESRARFVVPPRREAFVVPPDKELSEV